ncbi:zinc metalloproteinase nas-4-like [Pocillopora damicornis]|nr:zinc metalloproteinase nas-4-like [Pocillopora damicornis]
MIISPQQVRGLLLGQSRSARFVRRWPNGMVPYTIDWSLEREDVAKSVIAAAIEEWTNKTCLQFKERTSERAYVTFRIGSGCSASVGYQGYQQFVNLAPGCWHMGTVAHEIGHALGFFHEQSRLDRDRFVRVVWYNIQKGMGYNFMKVNHINSLEEPYDFDSVMHYGRTFFSKKGRPTLFPRKKGIEFGQRERESEGDARQMNKMYNCP